MNAVVHILATGARTPLGLTAETSAAAVRAEISSAREHPTLLDRVGRPVLGSFDSQLDVGRPAAERLMALAASALLEACSPLEAFAAHAPVRLPMFLALPEFRPGFTEQDADDIRRGFGKLNRLPVSISTAEIVPQGHAAGFSALALACESIRRGDLDICLVGGVDSYFQPETLRWLQEGRRLVGTEARSGFVPGEGAGFCLLASERARSSYGLQAHARVVSVAMGQETRLDPKVDVCLGEGLTAAVRDSIGAAGAGGTPIDSIVCDMNGERHRGEEWGFVCLRLAEFFDDPTAYGSPADCWGDLGAASAPLCAMLACQAARRGYAKGPRTLLWGSSLGGLRGAAVLETKATA